MHRVAFLIPLVILVALPVAAGAGADGSGRITVVFRYDDYCSTSSLAFETKLIEVFQKHGIAVTYGVIPAVRVPHPKDPGKETELPLTDPEHLALLRRALAAGHFEVAQHGYTHASLIHQPSSEFGGRPRDEQRQRIVEGRAILERELGIKINTFIPPWNNCDRETVSVLEELGFHTLSANLRYAPAGDSRLAFLPCTCNADKLKSAITRAREFNAANTVIVVIMHRYDFRDQDKARGHLTLGSLAGILEFVAAQKDVDPRTLGEAAEADATLTQMRCERAQGEDLDVKWRLLPDLLKRSKLGAGGVYLNEMELKRIDTRRVVAIAVLYPLVGAIALAVAACSTRFFRSRRRMVMGLRWVIVGVLLGLAAMGHRGGWHFEPSWKELRWLTVLGGAVAGWGMGALWSRRRRVKAGY